jgi:hypothetical protein
MDGPPARRSVLDPRATEFFAIAKFAHKEITPLPIMQINGEVSAVGMPKPEAFRRLHPANR